MSAIMVTGGAGFLGAHVAAALARGGGRVVVLDIRPPRPGSEPHYILSKVDPERLVMAEGDITDLSDVITAMKRFGVDRVVHAAALTHVPTLRDRPLQSLRVNLEGTVNVLEAARLLGIGRVVLTGSMSVYAPMQYEPMDEAHPLILPGAPPSLLSYSAAKQAAEAFAFHYWGDHGVDCVILRLSAIYGLGMNYPMYIKPMVEGAVRGEPVRFASGGDSGRDYTYVGDVVGAVLSALEVPAGRLASRVYNVATGRALQRASEVADRVRQAVPGADILIGPGIPEEERKTAATRGVLSIVRAREELGFEPQYDLARGVAEYVGAYREYITVVGGTGGCRQ